MFVVNYIPSTSMSVYMKYFYTYIRMWKINFKNIFFQIIHIIVNSYETYGTLSFIPMNLEVLASMYSSLL